MPSTRPRSDSGLPTAALLIPALLVLAAAPVLFAGPWSGIRHFEPLGVSTGSRLLNGLTTALITSVALVVPLTANLYSPRLVKVYIAHPLVVGGIGLVLAGHLGFISYHFFPQGHAASRALILGAYLVCYLALAGFLPFLYALSQFLRPSFFVPLLTRSQVRALDRMSSSTPREADSRSLFETIDVVANMALTGMARGDRQLVHLCLESLHVTLLDLVARPGDSRGWRDLRPWFAAGLAEEGQDYLIRRRLWPEAYVLAQMQRINEAGGQGHQEVLAALASNLVETASLSAVTGQEAVVDLHLMTFNTLFREVILTGDARRFATISYYYRRLIEAFSAFPERRHEAAKHLVHYARMGVRMKVEYAMETVAFDLGELLLRLGYRDQAAAEDLLLNWAGPLWQSCIEEGGHLRRVGYRALIRAYWEARASELASLADAIRFRFLSDPALHREELELALDETRELHFEFNDRLLRFAHFSPEALQAATAFLDSW
jgi:hypothetical protein